MNLDLNSAGEVARARLSTAARGGPGESDRPDEQRDYLTVMIDDQEFGVPALMVHDIMEPQQISPIPLAPPEVLGALNLRGHIVTAIDMRMRLGLPPREKGVGMSVVVKVDDVSYSLIVDAVGEVMGLNVADIEAVPSNLASHWADLTGGVYRQDGKIILMLVVEQVLDFRSFNED